VQLVQEAEVPGDVAAACVLGEEAPGAGARVRGGAQDIVAGDQPVRDEVEQVDRAQADAFDGAALGSLVGFVMGRKEP